MKRLQLILYADGLLVFCGLLFLARLFRKNQMQSHFRDDLWATQKQINEALSRPENLQVAQELDQLVLPAPNGSPKHEAAPYKTPKFNGLPHEVLGLHANPSLKDVQLAFRYWIKRYHPDYVNRLGAEHVRQAVRRAEQLNRARQTLLKTLLKKT